ncbi:MbtH family protein [Amycolatopsis umgeniensis]|uniref:MbtH protein n=1 Tax=Amycolatopsis umgeniensis TaxID=336628 RepID=A0A841AVK0_9PSEU|nr:MbtH protein [Amycolatopsis umgeniensis]
MTAAEPREGRFQVVINHEEQYSVWPATGEPPAGWRPVGYTGTRTDCLGHIERVWTDITPKSVRDRAAASGSTP